jgi:Flp pilus assembly protein TadG
VKHTLSHRRRQAGATIVEFALTALVFFVVISGIVELGHIAYVWNATAEATRAGARAASVSSMNSAKIGEAMRAVLPDLTDSQFTVEYSPAGCNADNCELITVSIDSYAITPLFMPGAEIPVPRSITTLQREGLGLI